MIELIPNYFMIPFLFILGSIFGSFFNVVIYRLPNNNSIIWPASHCLNCKTSIKYKDNIPILSYLLLGGKCRLCESPFSSRYLLVEILTAVMTVCFYIIFGLNINFVMYLFLIYLLIPITFIDIDHFIIPNEFILLGLLVLFIGLPLDFLPISWEQGLYGALIFSGFLFFIGLIGQFILKKESIGFGDVKLGLILGGYLGVEYSILALYLSFAISAIMVFILLGSNIIDRKAKIPFGPYLAGGTLSAILTTLPNGDNIIINWYYQTMF
ncbi:MAG: prepilin peptidase [Euryarchaeota archaeon]|nr:prepilin peptidase [Euryarchaeota archaeon]